MRLRKQKSQRIDGQMRESPLLTFFFKISSTRRITIGTAGKSVFQSVNLPGLKVACPKRAKIDQIRNINRRLYGGGGGGGEERQVVPQPYKRL